MSIAGSQRTSLAYGFQFPFRREAEHNPCPVGKVAQGRTSKQSERRTWIDHQFRGLIFSFWFTYGYLGRQDTVHLCFTQEQAALNELAFKVRKTRVMKHTYRLYTNNEENKRRNQCPRLTIGAANVNHFPKRNIRIDGNRFAHAISLCSASLSMNSVKSFPRTKPLVSSAFTASSV